MIEFERESRGIREHVLLDVRSISRFTPADDGATNVTLTSGTELVALTPYAAFREAVQAALGSTGPLAR